MEYDRFIHNIKDAMELDQNFIPQASDDFKDYDQWDSLTSLSLVAMLDEEYGVQIESNQINGMASLIDLFQFVKDNRQDNG